MPPLPERLRVSSADFVRNVGHWLNEALHRPVGITHHERERLVIATPKEFAAAEAKASEVDDLLEELDEGFITFDASLRVKRSNVVASAFLGRSREAVLGARADELPTPVSAILCERLRRVMGTRNPEIFETSLDGRLVSMCVLPLPAGAAVLFTKTNVE